MILRVVEALEHKYSDVTYGSLISDLSINIISKSQKDQNILEVIYENPDKEKVVDVVDTLVDVYQNYSVEKRQSGVKRGIAFLDRQIPQISNQAQEIEFKIAQLRSEYNFNDPEASLTQITDRIYQLDLKREENELRLQELYLDLENLDRELTNRSGSLISADKFVTPKYAQLLEKQRELDLEINQKSAIFSDRSEILQLLKQEKQQLNLLLTEAVGDIRRKAVAKIGSIENRQQNLITETSRLKNQLKQWSEISGEYNSLQNRLNRTNNKLNEFNSQKDALQIDAAQQDSPWQLLTPPRDPANNDLSLFNYLVLSSTLGLFLGTGVAFLLDKQQNIIYGSAKVEEITDLPILGAIPYGKAAKPLFSLKPAGYRNKTGSQSFSSNSLKKSVLDLSISSKEAFRSFAANLGLLNFNEESDDFNLDAKLKSIVITSAIPREGKSTVVLNLARATASIGKRVLIVDTDLRSVENLTKDLGFSEEIGLRNILQQNSLPSGSHYIKQISLEENLFILTSGFNDLNQESRDRDPSRLLASVKMRSMMAELKNQFDLVIYDLCSIIGFADVNLLANQTDGIILVTGLGKIQSVAFTEALNQLQLCNAPVLGVALNKLVNQN